MLVSIKRIGGEDAGVKELTESPPLVADGEPHDGVTGMVVGGEGVGDMAGGESKVLLLEDFFGGGGGGDD